MEMTIKKLDPATINQIKAGEVIENSASVIKELLDNAIDACASKIVVEIEGGGRSLIRVTDDGIGMHEKDAKGCFLTHATSKLSTFDDLTRLETRGFRGEALSSIASIGKCVLMTKREGFQGVFVAIEGGELIETGSIDKDRGSIFEVRSLFFNTPVRKKFLKAPSADTKQVLKIVKDLALSNPSVSFELFTDGEKKLFFPSQTFFERAKSLLGEDLGNDLHEITLSEPPFSMQAVIGGPSIHLPNRTSQTIILNKRPIVSPLLSFFVKDAFGHCLGEGRFPAFTISLEAPPSEIDINVHPQKKEVRIKNPDPIRRLIFKAVQKIQRGFSSSGSFEQSSEGSFEQKESFSSFFQIKDAPFQIHSEDPFPKETGSIEPFPKDSSLPWERDLFKEDTREKPLFFLGFLKGYILLENNPFKQTCSSIDPLFSVVDQKRAFMRILYEKKKREQHEETLEPLLIPYTFETTKGKSEKIKETLPLLHELGLDIEPLYSNTFIIHAISKKLGAIPLENFVSDVLALQEEESGQGALDAMKKKLIASLAKNSEGLKRKLDPFEAKKLLEDLKQCSSILCPYGKPIVFDVEKDAFTRFLKESAAL